MKEGGYIKLFRSISDHPVWEDAWILKLFIWCVKSARYTKSEREGQPNRGQFFTTRSLGAEALKVSEAKWYRGMERLVELGSITIETGSKRTAITVCNYDDYQEYDGVPEQQVNSNRTASEQPSLKKEGKKERTSEPEIEIPPPQKPETDTPHLGQDESSGEREHEPGWLARMWIFHRKGNKGQAELLRASSTFEEMIRLGCNPAKIAAEIMRGDRRKTEAVWDFEKRLMQCEGLMNASRGGKVSVSETVRSAAQWANEGARND